MVDVSNYEKIIIYSYWLNTNAIIAFLLKRYWIKKNKNVYSVSRAHGQGDLFLRDNGDHVARPGFFALQRLDRVFTISEKGKSFLEAEGFLNAEVSKLGTFGGEVYFDKNKECFHIVSCSTVNENKNVLGLAKQIAKLTFPITWTHFGDGPLFGELVSFCSNCTNKSIVFDLKGNVENRKIKEFYGSREIDLFVNISTIEGIPVSIMEAMSYGIPCIGTNVGATSEIVINDYNGFLIEVNQIEELSKILCDYFFLDANKKKLFRENAFFFWKQNYNALNNYKHFKKRLDDLTNN